MFANAARNLFWHCVSDTDLRPFEEEIGVFKDAFQMLSLGVPSVKYRVTLCHRMGGKDIPLGIISAADSIPVSRLRCEVRKTLIPQKLSGAVAQLKKPKLRKYRKTVEFYDGDKIVKKLGGTTQVPRVFKYTGTTRSHDMHFHVQDIRAKAWREWETLRSEAERQERLDREVRMANESKMREYESRKQSLEANVTITDREIDVELSKYILLIERSRMKFPKPAAGN